MAVSGSLPQPGVLELDIHGMTVRQAKTFLESQLRKAPRSVYRIAVIHGYRGGTELRELVRGPIAHHPKVLRYELGLNPGVTELVLRELY